MKKNTNSKFMLNGKTEQQLNQPEIKDEYNLKKLKNLIKI